MGDRYIEHQYESKHGRSSPGGLAPEVAGLKLGYEQTADGNTLGGYNELLQALREIEPCQPGGVKDLVAQFDGILLDNPAGSCFLSEYDLSGMLISRAPGAVFEEFLDFYAERRSAPYAQVKNLLIELDENSCIAGLVDGIRETTLDADEVPQGPDMAQVCPGPQGINLTPEAAPSSPKEMKQQNIGPGVGPTPAPAAVSAPVVVSAPAPNPVPAQATSSLPREVQPWYRDPKVNLQHRNWNPPAAPKRRAPAPGPNHPRPTPAPAPQSRPQASNGLCNNCWLPGHPTLNCPYPHNSQAERNQVRVQRGYKSNMSCWNCLSNTHLAEDCREGRPGAILPYMAGGGRKAIDDARICWNCWEWGHSSSKCTEADRNWVEREELRLKKRGQFSNPSNKTFQSYTSYR